MGRQILFFFSREDEIEFLTKVHEMGLIIMDEYKNKLFAEDIKTKNDFAYFISYENSNIVITNDYINQIYSDIIKFTCCKSWKEKTLDIGRIWIEMRYYDSSDNLVKKDEILEKIYNQLVRWIKKNTRISTNKFCYIGKHAYKLYKEEGWRMVQGAKVNFDFE